MKLVFQYKRQKLEKFWNENRKKTNGRFFIRYGRYGISNLRLSAKRFQPISARAMKIFRKFWFDESIENFEIFRLMYGLN